MSGAEAAIAGIGFLCNAMQIVTFGRDILQAYRQIRDKSSPDPKLEAYLKSAKACFDDMNSSALPLTRDQQQMNEIGKKLEESMSQLQSKFSELHIDDASRRGFRGKIEICKKSVASLWQGKELESLEINLKRYESLLHGIVLNNICNRSQAAEISSQQSFNQLNTNLQSVITQLADGCTRICDLSIDTKNLVTQEHEITREVIETGFATSQGAISSFRDSMAQEFQDMARRDQNTSFEKEHNQLLQSLRFPEMNSRRNHISENYPGTFNWVFKNAIHCSVQQIEEQTDGDEDMIDSPESVNTARLSDLNSFPTWLESDAQQFWISGKPASGKSSLMKFLATHPLTLQHLQAQHSNIQILTHYFWKPGQPLQKNIEGMALSLLHQLLHKDRLLSQRLWTEQPNVQDKRDRGDWDINELKKVLCWAIKFSGNTFCIFLDGLDEAKDFEDLPWGDHQNTQVIYDLLRLNSIKLCASSREEGHFCQFFAGKPCLRTHHLNQNDIYHYAENRLEVSGISSDHRSRLLSTVVHKANGVFLWVVLAVKSLNQAIRSGGVQEFKERLAQTPSDLHDLLVDMWNRPGDNAKLSTYKIEASRFFSLALAAIDIDRENCYLAYGSAPLPLHSMRSLIAMATALEDKPLTSILREGREVQAKELQARCLRAKRRLPFVCRGLLEITTVDDARYEWAGNQVLFDYAMTRVEFIHRCAFDFITDTQFGRECLALCHWSSIDKAERLLAGHLVKSRFLCYKSKRYDLEMYGEESSIESKFHNHQLVPALGIALNWFKGNISCRNSMFEELRDWQQRGLFYSRSYWRYPIPFRTPPNLHELEFLEYVARAATSNRSDAIVIALVEQLSIDRLVDAVPVLLCALIDSYGLIAEWCLNFIEYLLTRLQSATDEGWQNYPLQLQHDGRNVARLLHSWFVMQCVSRITDEWSHDGHKITDLLRRIGHTLSPADWQCPLILELGVIDELASFSLSSDLRYCSVGHHTVVIGNFVTAYRLLGQLLQQIGCALLVQPPRYAKERFEILLITGNADPPARGTGYFSPAAGYHMDIAICIKEILSERNLQVIEKRWSLLLHHINAGLKWVGKDRVGYCMKEVNRRGLELIHPWIIAALDN